MTNSLGTTLSATNRNLKDTITYTAIELETPEKEIKKWLKDSEFKNAVVFYKEKLWAATEKKLNQLVQGNNVKALMHQRECLKREIADSSFALEKLRHQHAKELIKYKKDLDRQDRDKFDVQLPNIKIEINDPACKDKIDKLLDLGSDNEEED